MKRLKNNLVLFLVFLFFFNAMMPTLTGNASENVNKEVKTEKINAHVAPNDITKQDRDTVTGESYSTESKIGEHYGLDSVTSSVYMDNFSKRKYLVKFKSKISKNTISQSFMRKQNITGKLLKEFKNFNQTLLELNNEEYQNLSNNPDVLIIEPDYPVTVAGNVYPNNETLTWGYEALNTQSLQNFGVLGSGIKVAIVDTGVDLTHSELSVLGGVALVSDSYNDDNGHGTQIAGIISSKINGHGTVGIAPNASIYSVKALDREGNGSYSQIVSAIDWCIENKINIINMSFTGSYNSVILQDAMKQAWDAGILVVASAGNEGANAVKYPARYPTVMSVGALNQSLEISPFSNYGDKIDLVAPGSNILTTNYNNDYTTVNGTSFSTAYITGAAAEIWSAHPDWTAEQVKLSLLRSSKIIGEKEKYGYGLVNLVAAYEQKYLRDVSIDTTGTITGDVYGNEYVRITSYGKSPSPVTYSIGNLVTTSINIEQQISEVYIGVFKPNRYGEKLDQFSRHLVHGENGVNLSAYSRIPFEWDTSSQEPGEYEIKYAFCYMDPIMGQGCHKSEYWTVNLIDPSMIDTQKPFAVINIPANNQPFEKGKPINVNISGYDNKSIKSLKLTVEELSDDGTVLGELDSWERLAASSTITWTPNKALTRYKFKLIAWDTAGNVSDPTSEFFHTVAAPQLGIVFQDHVKAGQVTSIRYYADNISVKSMKLTCNQLAFVRTSDRSDDEIYTRIDKPNNYTFTLEVEDIYEKKYELQEDVLVLPKGNIIFLPGIMGSNLKEYDDDVFKIDGVASLDFSLKLDKLALDEAGHSVRNIQPGVPGKQYYGKAIETLQNEGYNVIPMGYDWRLDIDTAADKLASYVEYLSESDDVSIVAHSMGGLVATRFIQKTGGTKIKKAIFLGTPFLGTPVGLGALENYNSIFGYAGDLFRSNYFPRSTKEAVQSLLSNAMSSYQLFPSERYFEAIKQSSSGNQPLPYVTREMYQEVGVGTNGRSIVDIKKDNFNTFDETIDFLKRERPFVNSRLINQIKQFHNTIQFPHQLVDSYYIVGDQNKTAGIVKYKGDHSNMSVNDVSNINGDGTVPVISADISRGNPDKTYYVDEMHRQLQSNNDVLNQVLNILNGHPEILASDKIRRQRKDTPTLKLIYECPVDVHIYSQSGAHAGPNTDGTIDSNIKNGAYYLLGDKKVVLLNKDVYDMKLIGTDNGLMNFTMIEYDNANNPIKTVRFENVPLSPTTIIKSNTDIDHAIILDLDVNGDGTTDSKIFPISILDARSSQDGVLPTVSIGIHGSTGVNDWYSTDTLVAINAEDIDSGVKEVVFQLDGNDINEYLQPFTVSSEGHHELIVQAIDKNGNFSKPIKRQINIDKHVPTEPTINYSPSTWTSGDATFTILSGMDGISGVQKSQYKFGATGVWTDYNAEVTISNEGKTSIFARTIDNAGNISAETSATVFIDKTSPTQPIINLSNSNWSNADVSFNINEGTDSGSTVEKTQYKYGANGTWINYPSNSTITVTTEGSTDVFARTIDKVGNISNDAHAIILIDRTAPTNPTVTASAVEWTNSNVSLTVSPGIDSLSGIQRTQYIIEPNGTWTDYVDQFTITNEGQRDVKARSIDNAGNISNEVKTTVKIDKTAPVSPTIVPRTSNWTNQTVTVAIYSGVDALSGVQKSQYQVGSNGQWVDYHDSYVISNEGITQIFARTIDNVGNISSIASTEIKIDKTPPSKPQNLTYDAKNSTSITLTWDAASDNFGVADYTIYDGTTLMTVTSSTAIKLSNLKENKIYKFTVKANDYARNSSESSSEINVLINEPIATADSHTLVLKKDGTVWAWGANDSGQLGNGFINGFQSTFITVPSLNNVVAVSANGKHNLAMKADGTVWEWGNGIKSPTQIVNLDSVIAVSAGYYHSVVLKSDGTVWGWGNNVAFQLGQHNTDYIPQPTQIPQLDSIVAISANNSKTVALKNDGTVWLVGYDGATQITSLGNSIKAISASYSSNLVLKNDGTVWFCERDCKGKYVPYQISIDDVVSISAGNSDHNLAIKSDGTAWAWGTNTHGELGNGNNVYSATPVQVSGLTSVIAVSASSEAPTSQLYPNISSFSVGMKNDGSIWTWGRNDVGQLGDGTVSSRFVPVTLKANTAPLATLTVPSGTSTSPTLLSSKTPSISWSLSDNVGTLFTEYQVQVLNGSTIVYDSGNLSLNNTATEGGWRIPVDMPTGVPLKTKIRVSDGYIWSGWSESWMIIKATLPIIPGVSTGNNHSLALKNDGTILAWGSNDLGQLGTGVSGGFQSTYTKVPGLDNMVAISANGSHSLALKSDGTAWEWGNGIKSPTQIVNLDSVIAVSAGYYHSVVLKSDGTVWGWGNNVAFQLGRHNTNYISQPTQIPQLDSIVAISANNSKTVALKNDGTVWLVGYDGATQIASFGSSIKAISAGYSFNLVLKNDGTVLTCESDCKGRYVPYQIPISNVVSISAGNSDHNLAIKSDGTAWAWGTNTHGELGNGSNVYSATPVQVSGLTSVIGVSASSEAPTSQLYPNISSFSVGMKNDGSIWTWGRNNVGQLGDGTVNSRSIPVTLKANIAPLATLTVPSGTSTSPTLFSSKTPSISWNLSDNIGTLFTEYQVQVLNGSTIVYDSGNLSLYNTATEGGWRIPVDMPTEVPLKTKIRVSDGYIWSGWSESWMIIKATLPIIPGVSTGNNHSLALKNDGTILAWGSNDLGQLGTGVSGGFQSTYTKVPGLDNMVAISANGSHSLALKSDGTAWEWGNGIKSPTQIVNLDSVIAVSAGYYHSVVLKSDGTVWGWGNNVAFQLGRHNTNYISQPTQIPQLDSIVAISANNSKTVALKNDGTVWLVGYDGATQIASFGSSIKAISAGYSFNLVLKNDGTVLTCESDCKGRYVPYQIPISNVVSISAGNSDHNLAIKSDGTAWAWGTNTHGELGNGSNVYSATPVQVSGLTSVIGVSASSEAPTSQLYPNISSFSVGMKNDGSIWTWGRNNVGQLGDGTLINKAVPVRIQPMQGQQ
ncbi:S8 family serine peptidase [Paenibacillus sp. HWE-109]|uniref:RCC1 domain-containing protein n=1 Tax=Paenibacillus sp. HWE-109 TaxID=1306526 RepID=UPI001EDDF101|nr:S8 family serine peptidase [Paenibacillus sp. HWE-109]UKS25760.1 S8 family serine peptidase [Paenibacillus sp. HWE-109]